MTGALYQLLANHNDVMPGVVHVGNFIIPKQQMIEFFQLLKFKPPPG